MAQTVLSVIGTAYRGTVEEQDDTVLWLTHMLQTSGLTMSVLLRANAVNYALRGQDASGLCFGTMPVKHPPALDADLAALLDHDVPVYYVQQDAELRGIPTARFIDGVRAVAHGDVAALFDQHDQVWHW
jgi:hypothetical protein